MTLDAFSQTDTDETVTEELEAALAEPVTDISTDTAMIIEADDFGDLFGNPTKKAPAIDREAFANALRHLMIGMTLQDIVAIITNPYDELIQYGALIRGDSRACQKTSLLFNPHRLDCGSNTDKRYGSIYKAMQSPDFHDGMARATIFRGDEMRKSGAVNNVGHIMYMTIQIGVNGTVYINEFPPHLARDMCKKYGLSRESRVLDPCAGWGGRMLGISVVAGEYTCYEPATLTAQGLGKLSDFIKSVNPNFITSINCQPYEDSDEIADHYDFAMTSPPYYDTEHYSDEDTNSFNRYPTFEEWCTSFYLPLVDKTLRQLKPGRPFIINIGDRKYPLTKVLQDHSDKVGYTMRRIKGGIMNNAGFGRDADGGEKFFELTSQEADRQTNGDTQDEEGLF